MGKASRRKAERRRAGHTQRSLGHLSTLVEMAAEEGMVKLCVGTDGRLMHYAIYSVTELVTRPLCGAPVVNLESVALAPDCPDCTSIPEHELAMVRFRVQQENLRTTELVKATIVRLGG